MIGYSITIKQLNDSADGRNLGVKLGRICIKKNHPVASVASYCGVSREAVYLWFKGKTTPKGKHAQAVQRLIDKLH